jgi:hypothetical protein
MKSDEPTKQPMSMPKRELELSGAWAIRDALVNSSEVEGHHDRHHGGAWVALPDCGSDALSNLRVFCFQTSSSGQTVVKTRVAILGGGTASIITAMTPNAQE